MSEEVLLDEQSHYEISLTAGQAFVAFVLLLLSLAASFAFGLMIGRGQADERLVVRKEPAIVNESAAVPKKGAGKIVELGVADDAFKSAPAPVITEEPQPTPSRAAGSSPTPSESLAQPAPVAEPAAPTRGPAFAQLLSTSDQKTAEALAAKLIETGFTSAYVDPTTSEKGTIYRVRIKFPTESDARAAESKLREFAKEVWITTKE